MKKNLLKNLFFLLVFSSLTNPSLAQNLVPNPSFEDTVQCPYPMSSIEFSTGWINPNGYSPNYFHPCVNISNPVNGYGVPQNYTGYQNTRTGMAYAGIYLPVASGNSLREYIQIQLSDTLISGTEYLVKFYVSLGDSCDYSVNSLGAYLSTTAINSTDNLVFNVIPQVVNNSITNPLTDKSIWQEVSGTYMAIGGEKFITIGNFEFDSIADTTGVGGGNGYAQSYYYIDDVSVEINPNSIYENNISNIFSFYPNPANDILNVELKRDWKLRY